MNSVLDGIGWVLWSATLGMERPIEERVAAAQAAGFTRLSVSPLDVAKAGEDGTTAAELGRFMRESGLEIVMDPIMNWYGGTPMPGRFAPFTADDVLRMCEGLQVVSMSAIGPFSGDEFSIEELTARFATFCDRAGDLGAQVHFEFMPMSAIKDLATASAIVLGADRPNGGILFDTWHFFRGTPDFSALEQMPGDRIFAVQVADAPGEVQGSVAEDTFNRLLPGDGSFDLVRVLRALDRIGGLRWVGPEVLSPATAAMAPADAARLAGDRVRDLIAQARSGEASP